MQIVTSPIRHNIQIQVLPSLNRRHVVIVDTSKFSRTSDLHQLKSKFQWPSLGHQQKVGIFGMTMKSFNKLFCRIVDTCIHSRRVTSGGMGYKENSSMNCFVIVWCTCSAICCGHFELFFYERAILNEHLSACVPLMEGLKCTSIPSSLSLVAAT